MKKFICVVAILLSFTLSYTGTMAGQGNNLPSGPRYIPLAILLIQTAI
jgi:predicted small secreted protein